MGIFVKICGCTCARDVEAVAALAPDALGFIFWPGSRRFVDAKAVGEWTRDVPAHIRKVGVFVDASIDVIRATMDRAGLDVAQLHGQESPAFWQQLDRPCWRVVHLHRDAPAVADLYPVDALLIDYHGDAQPGGTGKRVDWHAAAAFVEETRKKVLLAGGLNRDNVREAIETVRPWGVDVSSGVEDSPGVKNMQLVKDFIEQCRSVT
jgi:phosphoribosylanthranilate isomerase